MSSFGLLLFLFVAAHPQKSATVQGTQQVQAKPLLRLSDGQKQIGKDPQTPTCYTIRSYRFHQQDGLAPVPAGMTTCTPANKLQQRRVSHVPDSLFMPLGLSGDGDKKVGEQKPAQDGK
jgi:hypothetical protein